MQNLLGILGGRKTEQGRIQEGRRWEKGGAKRRGAWPSLFNSFLTVLASSRLNMPLEVGERHAGGGKIATFPIVFTNDSKYASGIDFSGELRVGSESVVLGHWISFLCREFACT